MPGKAATEDETLDRVLKALSSSTRRRILDLLRDHPRTTGELCANFPDLDRCTTMQHLGVLERAGLVVAQRKGRERWIGDYARSAVELLATLKSNLEEATA